jgi:hypothetical protein
MATTSTLDVSHRIGAYGQMELRWELPASLWGGTYEMRKKGQKYLPADEKESPAAYTSRLNRSFLFNGFKKTVNTMVGKVFSKPIIMKDDNPTALKDWAEAVDSEGRRLDLFAEDVFREALKWGLCHVFVDMPKMPANATLADEKAMNAKPYWNKVIPQHLIGWQSIKVGAIDVLTSIRIWEEYTEADGDYGEKKVQRIREVTRTEYKIWELRPVVTAGKKSTRTEWQMIETGPMTLGYIPLFTIYTQREGFMLGSPPLEDLCWINVAHWQSSSDQRHILHVARVPILFGSGLGDSADKIIVGPNRMIAGPESSDLKYVEHSGKAIESGREDLKDLESQMKIMGLELLLPNTSGGGQTATAKSLDYADVNSPLQFMAIALQDALEAGLQITADWMKIGQAGSLKVNTDYGITLRDAADVQALIQARIAGEISDETFWTELKRRNILSEDFDVNKEKSLLKQEQDAAAAEAKALAEAQAAAKPPAQQPGAARGGTPGVGSDVQQ